MSHVCTTTTMVPSTIVDHIILFVFYDRSIYLGKGATNNGEYSTQKGIVFREDAIARLHPSFMSRSTHGKHAKGSASNLLQQSPATNMNVTSKHKHANIIITSSPPSMAQSHLDSHGKYALIIIIINISMSMYLYNMNECTRWHLSVPHIVLIQLRLAGKQERRVIEACN